VRLYTQLGVAGVSNSHIEQENMTPAVVLGAMRKVLRPYELDYSYCEWWTCYRVGQRVANDFTDEHKRVFLAGDAVHTHSPKGGQGMNTSLQDTYNLGWKLATVIRGQAPPKILETYELERRFVALELIRVDHLLTAAFSTSDGHDKIWKLYRKFKLFLAGIDITYTGLLLASPTESENSSSYASRSSVQDFAKVSTHLACMAGSTKEQACLEKPTTYYSFKSMQMGKRLGNFKIWAHADGRQWWSHQLLKSNGKWKIFVFAGDVGEMLQLERVRRLGIHLSANSSLFKAAVGSIEVITIHCSDRRKVEMSMFPRALYPYDDEKGFDYEKLFIDQVIPGFTGDTAYELCGVSRVRGCITLIRPDQHVSYIGELESFGQMEQFIKSLSIEP
jgi:phenol 2-monooxygenase (NADPH)